MLPTTVTRVQATALDLALTEPFAIATGAQHQARNVLVRVTLADGTVGLGEAAPFPVVSGETQAGTLAAVERVRERLVGADARRWRPLSRDLGEALVDAPAARCGLEAALLDALTRHLRIPLWAWLGGAETRVRIDMTVTAGDADHAEASARAILARGISILKVKVGAGEPEADVERLVRIRAAAPSARLLADANGGWDAARAMRFVAGLRRHGVALDLFEQPVAADDLPGMHELVTRAGVPICADESARSPEDVLRLIEARAAHAVNIKPMKCGVVDAMRIWSLARTAGLGLMIGAMVESRLGIAFNAHFAAGLGGFDHGDLDTHLFFREDPFRGGFDQQGDVLDVGAGGPGAGVEGAPG